MTTENPMRIVGSSGAGKWSPSRGAAAFAPAATSLITDELGLLFREHDIDKTRRYVAPNRSGSAPPSIEGSFEAFGDLINKQPLSGSSLVALSNDLEKSHSEALQQANMLYSTYDHLNDDLYPRLPPHVRKSIHLGRHAGLSGNNLRLSRPDGCGRGPAYMPGNSLSTHEEEPEGGRSLKGASNDRAMSNSIMLGQNTLSSNSRHKSLVDHIQEDFLRTPSPVFSLNHSPSHVEEPFDHDIQGLSLDTLSIKASGAVSGCKVSLSHGSTTAAKEPSAASALGTPGRSLASQKDESTSKAAYFTSDFASGGTIGSDASKRVEDNQDKQEPELDGQDEPHVQNTHSQHAAAYQVQRAGPQAVNNYIPSRGHVNNTSLEMQQSLHSPGVPHPLYATTAAHLAPGNSFYSNFSMSGIYTPQYIGYAMSSIYLPPYLAGYTGVPLHFIANSGQSFRGQATGFPTGESISKGSVMQNLNRVYSQHGLTMHSSFADPLPLQYFQRAFQDPYGVPVQYNQLPSSGAISNQVDSFALHNDPTTASFSGDQKTQLSPSGSVGFPSVKKIGIPSTSNLSNPTGLGFVPQFRASPLGSPILPESPVRCANSLERRYDIEYSQSSAKNISGYARWQGQRGTDNINDHRKHSFLEELKANSARRIDLSDIVGRIVDFSIDQHGSRFIQHKLENCRVEEKELVFKEVLPHASKLMTDVFGNYIIQKFFEHGTYEQRKELASQLSKQMLPLTLQMYGCRVIQKALEVIDVDQKTELVLELDGHVMRCVRDQNGNHVIQKCIECIPTKKIEFIISAFQGEVATLSTHPYGCRVIQRVLEHCSDDIQCRPIVDEIMEAAYDLAHDQYGNYVTQHVLERGKPFVRSQIIRKLQGKILQMSQHKYASNVVEKCLEFGSAAEQECLIEEILMQSDDSDNLLAMMKDQFANYVVQKIIEISNSNQRERVLDRIRVHVLALKKYTYGKHTVARFEQLTGEDNGTSQP